MQTKIEKEFLFDYTEKELKGILKEQQRKLKQKMASFKKRKKEAGFSVTTSVIAVFSEALNLIHMDSEITKISNSIDLIKKNPFDIPCEIIADIGHSLKNEGKGILFSLFPKEKQTHIPVFKGTYQECLDSGINIII